MKGPEHLQPSDHGDRMLGQILWCSGAREPEQGDTGPRPLHSYTQLHTATHSYTQPSRYKLYPTNPNWLSLLLSATTRGGAANCKLVQTLDRGWLLVKCRKWLLLWLKLCSTTGAMKNIKTHPYNYFVYCVSRGLTANTSYRYVDMSG